MSDEPQSAQSGLLDAARRLMEMAAQEPAAESLTGAEITTIYEVMGWTTRLLHGYTITGPLPELQAGAAAAAADLHRSMRQLEEAWIKRYPTVPIADNVIPLRRAA
ncbi:MAG: hypothetical protein HOY79_49785 [Streptomyces sp.]|nr:hypothetical protein [Streptomyces sp.]